MVHKKSWRAYYAAKKCTEEQLALENALELFEVSQFAWAKETTEHSKVLDRKAGVMSCCDLCFSSFGLYML